MKIASNRIVDIIRYFRDELKDRYEAGELETIIGYCFEEFVNIKRGELGMRKNDTVSESELLKFSFAVKDLKRMKPIQYVLGKADFYGMTLKVNEDVLIPRPETEELVDLILKEYQLSSIKYQDRGIKILDIGTGSGCIAIALKKNIVAANVMSVDVSEGALRVAKENAIANGVEIDFVKDDILKSNLKPEDSNFDIIVSNPPYVCESEKGEMQRNVLDYEPHLALFVEDNNPLLFYTAIADFALKQLAVNGKLYFEINQMYGEETKKMLLEKGFKNVELKKDLNNKNRILRGEI